jgi:hypothetical protein
LKFLERRIPVIDLESSGIETSPGGSRHKRKREG